MTSETLNLLAKIGKQSDAGLWPAKEVEELGNVLRSIPDDDAEVIRDVMWQVIENYATRTAALSGTRTGSSD